jgi:hypothetical protein
MLAKQALLLEPHLQSYKTVSKPVMRSVHGEGNKLIQTLSITPMSTLKDFPWPLFPRYTRQNNLKRVHTPNAFFSYITISKRTEGIYGIKLSGSTFPNNFLS